MSDNKDDVTSNKKEHKNHNDEYGTAWYLKSHEYNKDKRRVRRAIKRRRDDYGKVFS